MSSHRVNQLRKEGDLKGALKLALTDLSDNPDDIWNKRAISWVYFAYLKEGVNNLNEKKFLIYLEKIVDLNLPPNEKMLFDSVAWTLGKFCFRKIDASKYFLNKSFLFIQNFHFSKPSDPYSFLLKAYKKHANDWDKFYDFVEWWGMENFQPKDYENFINEKGMKLPSMVEAVFISLSKYLLSEPYNKADKIEKFLPKISQLSSKYKKMQYPPYYYAKLLLIKGDKDLFMQAFLPFIKKKQKDFWVWNLMSEVFDSNSKEYFSCLCKSLSCGAPEKFIINVREKIADVFISENRYNEAKAELTKIIEIRNNEGWPLKYNHIKWQNLPWWKNTTPTKSNHSIYVSNCSIAEGLLFADLPEELIFIQSVNKEKTVINFIASKQKYGLIHYGKFNVEPKLGQVYAVRFTKNTKLNKSSFYQVKTIVLSDQPISKDIYKQVKGKVLIKTGNSFGFICDTYIPQIVVDNYKLKNGEYRKVNAVLSLNKKRNIWGWKAISVESDSYEKNTY